MTFPFVARLFPGLSPRAATAVLAIAGVGGWMRIHNAASYPPDWGFDATFNWSYIARLGRDFSLPHPAASWATADPPLYFYASALLLRACEALGSQATALLAVPLLGSAAGLGIVAIAVAFARRSAPDDPQRALLAGGLLLFLPAHIHMSVMVYEEIVCAFFTALALYALTAPTADSDPAAAGGGWRRAVRVGLPAGLAVLTKLTGVLVVVNAAATLAIEGLRERRVGRAATQIAVLGAAAMLAGGWYFARNQVLYGYIQPFGLPAHQIMFELPPGERSLLDFVVVPLATFTDPQLLNPDLLRSVWGGTYATLWFDGHRSFLPLESVGVNRLGTAVLVLALLPSAAFALGLLRGVRRVLVSPSGPDVALILCCALTLGGYATFNARNPWYTVVKGTSLLAMCLPFAWYASGELIAWSRRGRRAALCIWLSLALLAAGSTAASTFGLAFEKTEVAGLPWQQAEP